MELAVPRHCGISNTAPALRCHILVKCDAAAYSQFFRIPVVSRLSGEGGEEHHVLQDMASVQCAEKKAVGWFRQPGMGIWLGLSSQMVQGWAGLWCCLGVCMT